MKVLLRRIPRVAKYRVGDVFIDATPTEVDVTAQELATIKAHGACVVVEDAPAKAPPTPAPAPAKSKSKAKAKK